MGEKDQKFTSLDQIGEFGLIDILTQDFDTINDSTILSVGDDAAVVAYEKEKTHSTCDFIGYVSPKQLGLDEGIASWDLKNRIPRQKLRI